MVQVDLPAAFAAGSIVAAAAEKGLKSARSDYFFYRGLASSLLLQIFLFIWLPLFFLINEFGLQISHMWWHRDSVADYPFLLPVFFVAYFLANVAGYAIGVKLVKKGQMRLLWTVVVVSFTYVTAWIVLQPYRTLSMGTYDEWRAGTAQWLWTNRPLFVMTLLVNTLFVIALVVVYRSLKRDAAAAAAGAGTRG